MSEAGKEFEDLHGNTIGVQFSPKKKKVEIWVHPTYLQPQGVEFTANKARKIAEEIIRLANEIEGAK